MVIQESINKRKTRAKTILSILKKTYPHAKIALRYSNPWELLVAVVLSAQCTDKKVNEVTETLFKKYPAFADYLKADVYQFAEDIKPTGFYKNKAKNILSAAKIIKEKFAGQIPQTMEELTSLPGVARKTANIILGNAYGIVEGIAVDTHVQRISQRLRLVDLTAIGGGKKKITFKKDGQDTLDYKKDADPNKIEQELMKVIPKDDWFNFTYLVINHGRNLCKAQNPDCLHCPLTKLCPASRAGLENR